MKYYLEFLLVKTLFLAFTKLPRELTHFLAGILSDFVFYVLQTRKKTVITNLVIAFGKTKTPAEIYKIARETYRNIMKTFIDDLYYDMKYTPEQLTKLFIYHGKEYLAEANTKNKGTIIVSAHFGNWELLGTAILACGYPVTYMIAEFKNKMVDDMVNYYRRHKGLKLIFREFSPLRNVIRALKNNEIVCFASDQDAGAGGLFVNFFNKPASTPQGAAAFSVKTGAPIIVAMGIPTNDRKKVNIHFIPIQYKPAGNESRDVFNITQEFTSIIEKYVSQYPQHYFWMHRRWKSICKK